MALAQALVRSKDSNTLPHESADASATAHYSIWFNTAVANHCQLEGKKQNISCCIQTS